MLTKSKSRIANKILANLFLNMLEVKLAFFKSNLSLYYFLQSISELPKSMIQDALEQLTSKDTSQRILAALDPEFVDSLVSEIHEEFDFIASSLGNQLTVIEEMIKGNTAVDVSYLIRFLEILTKFFWESQDLIGVIAKQRYRKLCLASPSKSGKQVELVGYEDRTLLIISNKERFLSLNYEFPENKNLETKAALKHLVSELTKIFQALSLGNAKVSMSKEDNQLIVSLDFENYEVKIKLKLINDYDQSKRLVVFWNSKDKQGVSENSAIIRVTVK